MPHLARFCQAFLEVFRCAGHILTVQIEERSAVQLVGTVAQAIGTEAVDRTYRAIFVDAEINRGVVVVEVVIAVIAGRLRSEVVEGEQDRWLRAGKAVGVDRHRSRSDARKIVLDAIIPHGGASRQDFFQQLAQRGDVPPAIVELIDEPAFGVGCARQEGSVKRTVGRRDTQIAVEHDQRLV